MVSCLAVRVALFRHDFPPPRFVLAGMGFAAEIVGPTMLLIGRIVVLSAFQRSLSQLFLYEDFILGPVIGIGGFLFPRFLHSTSSGRRQSTWNHHALIGFVVGLAVLATYIAQSSGYALVSSVVWDSLVTVYLLYQISPFMRGTGTLSTVLRTGIEVVPVFEPRRAKFKV